MRTDKATTESPTQTETLTGIIIPIEWDENGSPLKVGLASDDEQIYLIDDGSLKSLELRALVARRVKLTGFIGKRGGHNGMITVKSYEPYEI